MRRKYTEHEREVKEKERIQRSKEYEWRKQDKLNLEAGVWYLSVFIIASNILYKILKFLGLFKLIKYLYIRILKFTKYLYFEHPKKIILILIIFFITGCASTALAITGGKIISHNFKIYHFSDDDYLDIFNLKNGERITKYCTKHEKQVEVRKIRTYHDGVDRTIWMVDIVETVE